MPEFYPLQQYTRSCVLKRPDTNVPAVTHLDGQGATIIDTPASVTPGATLAARELRLNESMPLPYSNSQTRGESGDFLIDADDGSVSLLKRADFVAQDLALDHYTDS